VWSKIPFMLEHAQIQAMDPVRISHFDWDLELASADNDRSLIGTNPTGWNLVRAARAFAFEKHNLVNHRYADKYLYSKHLRDVADAALGFGTIIFKLTSPDFGELSHMIALAYVHDVIEDCGVTYNDVKKALGKRLADLAYALTNDKGRTREERAGLAYYDGIVKEPGAKFGKLCDRYANIKMAGSMKDKYRKEFDGFAAKLRHEGEYDVIWSAIEKLLNS
jgi:(p)ppGpp synthase/HD superfamily hydrolase